MSSSNTIIIGAGRLGSTIARSLQKLSNVIVLDRDKEKIDRLGEYSGYVEVGDATDCSILEKCGIAAADHLIAVTDDDNINVFLADLCTYHYNVPDVTIRLKDSRKRILVDERVNCICPFDLSLDWFNHRKNSEVKE